MQITLDDVVIRFGGEVVGDGRIRISGVSTLDAAGAEHLSFFANPKYRTRLTATRAAAVILSREFLLDCPVPAIVTSQPYLYFARVAQWLHPQERPKAGTHPSAVVEGAVSSSCYVGPNVWVGPGARIGDNVVVEANCSIGADCEVGNDSWLYPGVSIYQGCRVGRRAILHAGCVIGSDGFGFARDADGAWVKIPQSGRVLVGDDVEVGANTTIDRGALQDTVIEEGVKLDNQIQVGHNVHIGAHTAIAGCVGIAGSAKIGRRCTIGGAAMILGHLEIADDVNISSGTMIGKSVTKAGNYTGMVPFLEHSEWLKNYSRLRHLDALADKIRALENRLADLENKS